MWQCMALALSKIALAPVNQVLHIVLCRNFVKLLI